MAKLKMYYLPNNICAIAFAPNANLQNDDINFLSKKYMERHHSKEFKIRRHVLVVFLLLKSSHTFSKTFTSHLDEIYVLSYCESGHLRLTYLFFIERPINFPKKLCKRILGYGLTIYSYPFGSMNQMR